MTDNQKVTITIGQLKRLIVESIENYSLKTQFSKYIETDGNYYWKEVENALSSNGFSDISISYDDSKGKVIVIAKNDKGDLTIHPTKSKSMDVTYAGGSSDYGTRLDKEIGHDNFSTIRTNLGLICMDWDEKLEDLRYAEMKSMRRQSRNPEGRKYIDKYKGNWPKRAVY